LVVDDEPAVRALIVRVLGEVGYEVVAVRDAASGLEAARAEGFDLIIANAFTPDLTGDAILPHLRRLFPDPPILHLDDVKPFSLETLLQSVALAVAEQTLSPGDRGVRRGSRRWAHSS
jgi:PleD family two-component response regulator